MKARLGPTLLKGFLWVLAVWFGINGLRLIFIAVAKSNGDIPTLIAYNVFPGLAVVGSVLTIWRLLKKKPPQKN